MMRLKLYLRNSARAGLSLYLTILLFAGGCSSSTEPTFLQKDISQAIEDICKKEYNIYVKSRLVGKTLWIYLPVEDMFTKPEKPEKYTEKFEVASDEAKFDNDVLKLEYAILITPEKEKTQEIQYDKKILEQSNNVWKTVRRVIFSCEKAEGKEPLFFCFVMADIKNGYETQELFYTLDMKKVSYEYISWGEYQHRSIHDMKVSPEIIGDKEGLHLEYKDFTMEDFLSMQIKHRIKLKFQRPEVEKNANIDREIEKIVANTLKIYNFKSFREVEFMNLLTDNKITLNKAAILSKPID